MGTKLKVWTDPERCSGCKYCSMDMDMDPFCMHPEVAKLHPFGLNLNAAIDKFCGEDLKLRVQRIVPLAPVT